MGDENCPTHFISGRRICCAELSFRAEYPKNYQVVRCSQVDYTKCPVYFKKITKAT